MSSKISHTKIYKQIAATLERLSCKRETLIKNTIASFGISKAELSDRSVGSVYDKLRVGVGTVISEMLADGLIFEDAEGYYSLTAPKPVIIRIERCEKEIIKAISQEKLTKKALINHLSDVFGTKATATHRDDEKLSAYTAQITKRMVASGIISFTEGYYSLTPGTYAKIEDVKAMLSLKNDFLHRLHEKGGEFFESYFLSLMKRYYEQQGKTVLECRVTGGAADGGIDGKIKTRDELGFIETILVQTKNRYELTSEIQVRGFIGAVCASGGTRGIFATSSGFHPSAKKLLDSLDGCIGISGQRIFDLAVKLGYGIKRSNGKLAIDAKVI